MNLSIRIVSTLVLASCILSCKKDKDSNSNANKTRLSKLITWKTATPSQNITTTEFIYDDQKRVVEISFLSGDSVNGEIKSAKYRSLKYFYNGSDKNPYKALSSVSNNYASNLENYYTFNSTGSLERDSAPPAPNYTTNVIKRYAYFTDKIIVQNETKDQYYTQKSKDSFKVANNNLVEMYVGVSPYGGQANGYKLFYDTKENPMSKLNIAAISVVSGISGFPSFMAPGFCKNNITEYNYGYSSAQGQFTAQSTYYYTYIYNDNNLPIECVFTSGNGNTLVKYYYIEQ
jgi:hypothetical protein